MNITTIIFIVYGFLLIAGGAIGKVQAGSNISLIAGCVSGVIVLISTFLFKTNPFLGLTILASVSGLLTVTFTIRLAKTGKFMPSGMLCVLSVIIVMIAVMQILKLKN